MEQAEVRSSYQDTSVGWLGLGLQVDRAPAARYIWRRAMGGRKAVLYKKSSSGRVPFPVPPLPPGVQEKGVATEDLLEFHHSRANCFVRCRG